MTSQEILKPYIIFTKFLGNFLGPNYEVVLHDVTTPEKSVIAIENSHVSGRGIGSPLTDLSLKILQDKLYLKQDYISNYISITASGDQVKSATYFIKDINNNLIGLLCINMDASKFLDMQAIIDSFMGATSDYFNLCEKSKERTNIKLADTEAKANEIEKAKPKVIEENLSTTTLEELTTTIINQVLIQTDIEPERMSSDEKVAIVAQLHEKGVFLLKGSVIEVAERLKTSEATIYRYLKQLSR